MITATAVVSIGVFICALRLFGVVRVAASVLVIAQKAVTFLRENSFDDRTREKELQHAALQLFGAFISILIRSMLTFLASLVPIWLASLMGLVKIDDVTRYLSRLDVIVITAVLIIAGYVVWIRLKPSSKTAFQVNYSVLDRLLHWLAFSTPSIQLTAADIEKNVFCSVYETVVAENPIFITSLPRAGTTLMLEVLHRFPSLASHTYRDMPFVMAPILWSRLSSAFRKRAEPLERAHGDGMQFGYDSPEAFEEILWRAFWPEKYTDTSIALWGADDIKDEARAFFVEHMKKIIALRRPDRMSDGRYISKNNGNLARLDLIGRMFPEAKILVPVRHPLEQTASLLRQHRNFIEMQNNEAFISRYMADIGHYEFGKLHRPIAFLGTDKLLSNRNPLQIDYWLAYWIAAFEYVLARRDKVILISYEAACADGLRALTDICAQLEIPDEAMLDKAASIFKTPSSPRGDKIEFDHKLRVRAEELYGDLIAYL
ncbi:sulfotransferase [bacterium]|nr:sulfotransferase [bacterium]